MKGIVCDALFSRVPTRSFPSPSCRRETQRYRPASRRRHKLLLRRSPAMESKNLASGTEVFYDGLLPKGDPAENAPLSSGTATDLPRKIAANSRNRWLSPNSELFWLMGFSATARGSDSRI